MGYEDVELLADCAGAVLARHEPASWRHTVDDQWHHVWPVGHRPRSQGWKLHLPATPLSACFVLSRSVEVLARSRCPFKFAKSMRELQLLLEPNADRSGAGKFVTVYPDDDEQAVRLAEQLHEVTLGLPGQAILSDRRYRPNSQVYYRYGTFVPTVRLTNDGEYVQMLRDPAGELVRDQRGVGRPTPEWITDDPFQTDAPEPPQVPESVLVGGLYRVHTAVRQSNRGGIYFATDTATGEEIVLKRFRRHTVATVQGTDARQLARAESRMLHALGPSGAAPKPHALFSHDLDFFVSQQRIDGMVLRRFVARTVRPTANGVPALDTEVVLDLARQLVDLVAKVHEVGYVHGDLTPNNVMVAEGNRLVLIDLESALRTWEVGYRMSTPGYTAPEERARERSVWAAPDVAVDLYGLGATLFHLASGGHPPAGRGSRMPELVTLTARHNPAVNAIRPVLTGLLAEDPRQRPSLTEVREALREPCTEPAPVEQQPDTDRLINDMLALIEATASPDAEWLWAPTKAARRYDPCAVHSGAAGVLAVLDQALAAGYPTESTLDTGSRWLAKRIGDEPRVLPGLVFGRAGTALVLARAGMSLTDESITEHGLRLARRLPTDWPVPDVWHGVAGAGLALVELWRSTGDGDFLNRAKACADSLLATRRADGSWTAGGEFILAGSMHWGFAHGTAGIGAFLLDLAVATGDERYLDAATQCARALGEVADQDGDCAYWPSGEDDENADNVRLTGLCSGSTGVGGFLLRFHAATNDAASGELAAAAARAVHGATWSSWPVWCHGLPSAGDFLLDCAETFEDPRYRDRAQDVAIAIAARTVEREGRLLTTDESGDVTPVYANGFAGPLSFLLRLRHGGCPPLLGAPRGGTPE